ncbi:MAG: hypothetical protein ACYS17_13955 [Planctomycetota bacterium]|jgi:hypothetical protein
MKRSGSGLIFVIVWAAVLFTSFVIGICVKEVRFHRARTVVEATKDTETTTPKVTSKVEKLSEAEKLAQELAQKAPAPRPGGGERIANRPPRSGAEGGMENMRDRFANMSEEERAKMRERFANMSDEERAQMMRERMGGRRREGGMRERMENMTEEEREAFRAQMRERMGGRRPGGGEGGRRRPQGDGQGGRRRQEDDSGDGAPPPKGRACFVAETPVWVDGKLVQISKVTAGQTVGKQLCGLWSLEQVEEHEGTFECRDILLESGNSIGVVDAHCFMLDSGQWMAAQNLTSGLRLKTLTGTVVIKSVTKRAVPYTGKVYNLKVKSSDQYMAGKDMVIVRDY